MSEHTPGPWTMHGPTESTLFQQEWHITPPPGESGPVAITPTEEDARLIAAAPDLLAACELALLAFETNAAIDWNVLSSAIEKAKR